MNFLALLTATARSYSFVNSARSALSNTFPALHLSSNPLVQRIMRSASLLHPPQPRYTATYDLQPVYDFIAQRWHNHVTISFKDLTRKTAFLLAARGILRSSDLARISSSSVSFSDKQASFVVKQPKESSVREPHRLVKLTCTKPDAACAVCTLLAYYSRTRAWRLKVGDDDHLFVSCDTAFKPVSSQRIAKWLKSVLHDAGVDTTIFKAHSIRSASATLQRQQGASADEIMAKGHWRSRTVFARFYDRSGV